jgi:WD40 repeat protein
MLTGKRERLLATEARAQTIAWRPDGKRLAAGCDDGAVVVWDTRIMVKGTPPAVPHH